MPMRMSKFEKTILWNPILPGALLLLACGRALFGTPTWRTALAIASCAVWFSLAIWNWRSKGAFFGWIEKEER